jgi:Pyruvate/2-oxoacid:ferredoxin oxidoreductase delta subunit
MKEIQCQICWSLVPEGEERCQVSTVDKDYLSCILCGAAAEKLGHFISLLYE